MYVLRVKSRQREELVEFTDLVRDKLKESGAREGILVLYTQHTTAGLTINENADPDVKHDMLKKLETLIPLRESYYQHAEGNSDSHVKTSLVGNSVTVLIDKGKLVLGTWQGIQFCEFDGPRTRNYVVKIISFDRARE